MKPGLNVLLTGASGLIGQAVGARGQELGWRVVPLRRMAAPGGSGAFWDVAGGRIDLAGAGPLDAVIHLAGETVAQRWTAAARRRIYDSRVQGTSLLGAALGRLASPPRVVIAASAIGYYGPHGDAWVDEDAPSGDGFLAKVCRDWEDAGRRALGRAGTRLVQLRLGLVLTPHGGALARMLPAFRFGLGGRLGDGQQYWSWITLADVVRVIEGALTDDSLSGPINAVSPAPVTNAEFTQTLGRALHRPTVLGVPRFAVAALFGDMGREALLSGTRVRPRRLTAAQFEFRDPILADAFQRFFGPA